MLRDMNSEYMDSIQFSLSVVTSTSDGGMQTIKMVSLASMAYVRAIIQRVASGIQFSMSNNHDGHESVRRIATFLDHFHRDSSH